MKKRLIIINGVMGVGKTTVSKELYKSLEDSFWLDGDNCWMMHPFKVSEENKAMVLDNITYVLNNFIKNSSAKYIILNWVIPTDKIMNTILEKLYKENLELYKITLTTTKEELIKRIGKDIGLGTRKVSNLKESIEIFDLFEIMNTVKIDTTNKEVYEIVDSIKDILNK